MKTGGPKRPIFQVPGYLGLIWSGDIQGIITTPWQLVSCNFISRILQNAAQQQTVFEPVTPTASRQQLTPNLPVKDGLLRFSVFIIFTVIFVLEVYFIFSAVGRAFLSFGRRAALTPFSASPRPSY